MIREDHIHYVPVTYEMQTRSGTEVRHCLYQGTSQQIADQVARNVKQRLDSGDGGRIELTPIAPYAVSRLNEA